MNIFYFVFLIKKNTNTIAITMFFEHAAPVNVAPVVYEPFRNVDGHLVDSVRGIDDSNGIKCGCGSKHVFRTRASLKTHFGSQQHKTWIASRNAAATQNPHVEMDDLHKEIEEWKNTASEYLQRVTRLENEKLALVTKIAARDKQIKLLTEYINMASSEEHTSETISSIDM